jgi:hypothetical protein
VAKISELIYRHSAIGGPPRSRAVRRNSATNLSSESITSRSPILGERSRMAGGRKSPSELTPRTLALLEGIGPNRTWEGLMPTLRLAFLARQAQVFNDSLNIGGAFLERFSTPDFPAIVPIAVIAQVDLDAEELAQAHTVRVLVSPPDGATCTVQTTPGHIMPFGIPTRADGTVYPVALPIFPVVIQAPKPGNYWCEVLVDDEVAARLPLEITEAVDSTVDDEQLRRLIEGDDG